MSGSPVLNIQSHLKHNKICFELRIKLFNKLRFIEEGKVYFTYFMSYFTNGVEKYNEYFERKLVRYI